LVYGLCVIADVGLMGRNSPSFYCFDQVKPTEAIDGESEVAVDQLGRSSMQNSEMAPNRITGMLGRRTDLRRFTFASPFRSRYIFRGQTIANCEPILSLVGHAYRWFG
jgi:hypothetical protein